MKTFSAAELQSYVNDTANMELRAAIEAAANENPMLAEQIAAFDPWSGAVAEAVEHVQLSPSLAQTYADAATQQAASWAKSMILKVVLPVAGATILAALLVGGYFFTAESRKEPPLSIQQQPAPAETKPVELKPAGESTPQDLVAQAKPTWLNAVADYVQLMTPKTFATPLPEAEMRKALALLDAELGEPVSGMVARIPELELRRAEILQFNGMPLGQLAFLDAQGEVVAFCIMARKARPANLPENTVSDLKQSAKQGLNIVSWDHNSHAYLVIGKSKPGELLSLAKKLSKSI
jgi:hypothetical protein